jgi:hypothetical protein
MRHYITFKNKFRPLIYPILASIVFTFFYLEIFLEAWYTEFIAFSIIVYVLFLAYTLVLPLILHHNYKTIDKGKELILDMDKKQLLIKKGEAVLLEAKFNEIKEIVIHQTNQYRQRTVNWFSWAAYYYYEITLNNGESQKITRLSIYDLDKKVNGLELKYKNYLFPMI